MSAPENFNVTGKGIAPASDDDDLRTKKMIEGAIEQGVMKAITSDNIVAGGQLDEELLGQKIGKVDKDNPSGILANTKSYVKTLSEIDSGFITGGKVYKKFRLTIKAAPLQNILIEEGILTLPVSPKEEPPPASTEQVPPKEEEEKKDPPPPEPPPEKKEEQEKEKEDRAAEEEAEDEEALEPEPQEPDPEEKIPPKKVPSKDPSESKSETEFVGETHFVSTRKSPLRIRSGPSTKNKILGRLRKGSRVRVIDEFLGKDCKWHKIEIVDDKVTDAWSKKSLKEKFKDRDGPLYCFGGYLQMLEGIPSSLPHVCDFEVDPASPEPEWKTVDPMGMSCFYNLKKAEYQTVVEMPYQEEADMEADYDSFEQSRPDIIEIGVRKLLYYYNKVAEESTVKEILNAFKGAYMPTGADGFYLDKRPGSFMRFLVCFPAKYFDAIPTKEVDLSNATEENTDPDLRSYSFAYSQLESKIELAAKKMEEYASEVENFDGQVDYVEYKNEAKRIKQFPASLNNFLSANGHSTAGLKKEFTLEFGFGKDFTLLWVFMSEDDKKAFPLKVGIVTPEDSKAPDGSWYSRLYPNGFGFKLIEPIKNSRTLAFIYFLDQMVEAINKGKIPSVVNGKETLDDLNWTKFTESFVYPMPSILPSAEPEESKSPTPKNAEKISKQKEKKHKKPAKTTTELEAENKELSAPDVKNKIADGRAKATVTVGDDIFSEAENLLNSISCGSGVDAIYDELVNRYDVESLSKLIISFIVSFIPFPDLEKMKLEIALDFIPTEKINNILEKIRSIEPKVYDRAMKKVQKHLDEYKDVGLETVEGLEEQIDTLQSFAGLSADSPELAAITVDVDAEPSATDLMKSAKKKPTKSPTKKK